MMKKQADEHDEAFPMPLWYLSFADANLPEGSQFLGAAFVRGFDIAFAAMMAHAYGCNPGGEVLGVEVPDHFAELIPQDQLHKLLSKTEVDEVFSEERLRASREVTDP